MFPLPTFSCKVIRDVENARECSVDEMLNAFLMDCMEDVDLSDKHPVLFKKSRVSKQGHLTLKIASRKNTT